MYEIQEQRPIVAKFGGTSMATAESIKRVAEIIENDSDRRFVVVSAPGKRFKEDQKITDLLLKSHQLVEQGLSFKEAFEQVVSRFEDIGRGLDIHTSVVGWLNSVYEGIKNRNGKDWIASRGEWLMARTFAQFLRGSFADAQNLIKMKDTGGVDILTYALIKEQLQPSSVIHVIPGFYGEDSRGSIKIFARGGSDITGAIIARGVNARVYENWTDVDGIRAVDPRVIFDARHVKEITYKEMRELGYRGADVLQMDSILPIAEVGIPIDLRNTFNSSHPGTKVLPTRRIVEGTEVIGIAGKGGFVSFQVEQYGMNTKLGIGRKVLGVFEDNNVSFEHDPTGLDSMSVIFHKSQLDGKSPKIQSQLEEIVGKHGVTILENIGLVCVVGEGISQNATKIHQALYTALQKKGIEVMAETFSTRGNNIVIAVPEDKVVDSIHVLYDTYLR